MRAGVDLAEVVTRMKLRGEVVIAPHHGMTYRAALSDGAVHARFKKKGRPAWAKVFSRSFLRSR